MKRKMLIVIFALILLALALVGAAWAADADQPRRRLQGQIVCGTVTALKNNTVWLETPGGNESSFAISDRTFLWVPGEQPTSTIELAVGDPVLAFGQSVEGETGSSEPFSSAGAGGRRESAAHSADPGPRTVCHATDHRRAMRQPRAGGHGLAPVSSLPSRGLADPPA